MKRIETDFLTTPAGESRTMGFVLLMVISR